MTIFTWRLGVLLVVATTWSLAAAAEKHDFIKGKICIGTNGRLSVPSNRDHHYRNLRERYTNCTYVDGNLELTWIQDEHLNLSFLQNIREVTGYVLISHVDVRSIVLPKLQIIRGRTLFRINVYEEEFALMITLSKTYSVEMPALRDILSGSVGILHNYNLCHMKTIMWEEIITGSNANIVRQYNFTSPERECPPCDKSCEKGCWGEGPHNCQRFSKINCSPQCYQGRCFGSQPRECCHLFCAGGCTGPKQSDCLACRNFYDDGVCTQECPPMQRYNPITYSWENNPNGKYAYGATCVKKCPDHLLKDNGACVRTCPPNKKAENGECVLCEGPCPKTCKGVDVIHSGNIDTFQNCTVIEGSITILDASFNGFLEIFTNYSFGQRFTPIEPDTLEVFSTLREITGYLNIQGSHPNFTDLSYFRNLEVIGGRQLTEYFSSLYIVKSTLKSLGLKSLRKITSGNISILENKDLCYVSNISWNKIKKSNDYNLQVKPNKDEEECKREGLVCDKECSSDGCWGPGPDQCLSCSHVKLGDTCLPNCTIVPLIYEAAPGLCKPCHEECQLSCHGPGHGNCTKCKNVRDGPFCVAKCPESKYLINGECQPCHPNCVDGCTGPRNIVGEGGCNSCEKAIINGDIRIGECLQKFESCPNGYYYEWVGPQEQGPLKPLAGKAICRHCHPRCKRCTGYGFHEQVCQECMEYKRGEQCEQECPMDHYAIEEEHVCKPCARECQGCRGPEVSDCTSCRNYRIYDDNDTESPRRFNCTDSCPPEKPYKTFPEGDGEPFCSYEHVTEQQIERPPTSLYITITITTVIVLLLLCCSVILFIRQKARTKEKTVKMTMALTGLDDNEPLRPTNVKPNLAKLRIIKEAEMRKGGILGYGAFGTVYKGVWIPEGENVKIPVAIKVLREGTTTNTCKEFLEEAYIMATVEHPHLLKLLAVCMTSQMMLVTQLMPLGCLVDYVRNNKDKIGSKPLLNWCTQIARGMAYLEEKRLVHRDLAARNVLVQNPNCVKITDFGLAKLLDINEDEYKAAGGKMPIKWLALECIQHRIFTHKSDVWAFGVTVWELLTYGGRPYENIPARNVPELLEKGERLPQPAICTIDVYMIMIKCWMLDAESRPSFKELAEEFAKMACDPGRYLAIQGDRFMKLPSFSSQEEKELIRNLSPAMDGPELLIDADEYLQPKSRIQLPPNLTTSSTSSSPHASSKNRSSGLSGSAYPEDPCLCPHHRSIRGDDSDVGGHTNSQAIHEMDNTSRYCSDPLKMVGTRADGETNPEDATKCEAHVGTLKLELPLDDDDYLMPSPQQAQTATSYMDLIGDTKFIDPETSVAGFRNFPDFLPAASKAKFSVDNPEYHMMNNQDVISAPAHTLGIPTGSEILTTAGQRLFMMQQKSSEEESDHEYYNDFDRLQRELQPLKPLRRNETTV